jgi:predicted RNA-binding protein with PUA-like domain
MSYWLVKSDPLTYSWETFVKEGKVVWDGVRNYQARNNLKLMKCNDLVLFYHSVQGLQVMGIARVVKEFYPDPSAEGESWVVVELEPEYSLKNPVSLERIKKDPVLQDTALIRQARLSVMPVSKEQFNKIVALGK